MTQENLKYKRVIIKLSGEALAGANGTGIDPEKLTYVCKEIADVKALGVDVGIVIGGGNFWRGRQADDKMNRSTADHMGMLATVMNALAIQDKLEQLGVPVRVQTALTITKVAEPYILRKAIRHFEKGRIVIFGCGTGSPFFSTDTAAALRSVEINADALLKATNVDGIFDKDPNKYADAVKYDDVTFQEVITKDLKVMDSTAFSLCKDNDMPIIVFNLNEPDNILRVVNGEKIGTTVKNQ